MVTDIEGTEESVICLLANEPVRARMLEEALFSPRTVVGLEGQGEMSLHARDMH
jgi:hypothetical protein